VRAIGRINPQWETEDLAYMFLHFPSGLMVQINASWASPIKIRRMIIGAEQRMMIYDDIEPTNKLVIHEYAASSLDSDAHSGTLTDFRLGNSIIPKYESLEPLACAVADFFSCIRSGDKPIADARAAIRVIRVLELAEISLKQGGSLVALV